MYCINVLNRLQSNKKIMKQPNVFEKKMCTTPPVVSKRNHKDGITGQSVTVTTVSIDMKSHRQVVYDVVME